MRRTRLLSLVLFCVFSFSFSPVQNNSEEKGTYDIFFMDKKVGYEEFIWKTDDTGYVLIVRGKMTDPVPVELENLMIRLNVSFIPQEFSMIGSISGIPQVISSEIKEGMVENTILVAGRENKNITKIKRDAFLLPNPFFSPYMVITKKFRCGSPQSAELSAYTIPQMEAPFSMVQDAENPCLLKMVISGKLIELMTDNSGRLLSLYIPSQNIRVQLSSPS
jgi:hypothetical protein